MTRVLVTGANGQLGSEIIERCKERLIPYVSATRADMDITRQQQVDKFILEHEPTHIIHCAAMTAVDECEKHQLKAESINGDGARFIAGIAQEIGAHVTYISTDYVFDGTKEEPYVETDATSPLSIYGLTKLQGENYSLKTGAVIRVSWLCGKTGSNIVKTILRLAAESDELSFVSDQRGCPTLADDASAKILDIALTNPLGIWHLTNQGDVSWYEFACKVVSMAGMQTPVRSISSENPSLKGRARRPKNSILKNQRMEDEGIPLMDHHDIALERLVRHLTRP